MKSELESVKKELEHVNSIVKGKEEELKALEDRLELEGAAKLAELKKKLNKRLLPSRSSCYHKWKRKNSNTEKTKKAI